MAAGLEAIPGEVIRFAGAKYVCRECGANRCCGCAFAEFGNLKLCHAIKCAANERQDGQNIIFEEVK